VAGFRRTHLVPVPEVASLQELNEKIAQIDRAEDDRILHGRRVSIGCHFGEEAELLAPVPFEAFDCGVTLTPKVGRDSRVTVRQRHYSVPARLIGTRVRVSLRANEVLVLDRGTVIARHARGTRHGESHDNLDHYLEILLGKPGALAGSTALATARSEGSFTPAHEAFWCAARTAHGDAAGTRGLIEVLLLHRYRRAEFVIAGITSALDVGSTSPELVAIEARKAENAHCEGGALLDNDDLAELGAGLSAPTTPPACTSLTADADTATPDDTAGGSDPPLATATAAVIPLHPRREPPTDHRPLPSVAIYDQLLSRHQKDTSP
jgi:hypothetical protein